MRTLGLILLFSLPIVACIIGMMVSAIRYAMLFH